ncbi:hypothetical protein ACHAXS_003233 [Conticribra weissflogii]
MIGVWHITFTIHHLLLFLVSSVSSFAPPRCFFSNNSRREIIITSSSRRLCQLENESSPLLASRRMQRHLLPFWNFDSQNPARLLTLSLSQTINDDGRDGDGSSHEPLRVAGASVSPLGFLVLLKASFLAEEEMDVVFPVQLTSPPSSSSFKSFPTANAPSASSSENSPTNSDDEDTENDENTSEIGIKNDPVDDDSGNNNPKRKEFTIPALFRENFDQTSVTTPEALTFLQLLNGVDMATPVFPPDSLSKIAVLYSFLSEGREQQQRDEEVDHNIREGGDPEEKGAKEVLQVEDELGLSSSSSGHQFENGAWQSNELALDYIRSMVQTTLPPGMSYMEASIWQRAKVQLPRVWLHGVRLEEVDDEIAIDAESEEKDCKKKYEGGNYRGEDTCSTTIATVPIRYILECSVDDKTKRLDIPLYAIPSFLQTTLFSETPMMVLRRQFEISDELLRETSHSYRMETSAAFISLALFQRYFKSSSSSGDAGSGPTLKVSTKLLQQLLNKERGTKDNLRYCWMKNKESNPRSIAGDDDEDHDSGSGILTIDDTIQSTDLPLYRPLTQLQEEDQRVLSFLKKQNFGKGSSGEKSDKRGDSRNDSRNPKTEHRKDGGSDGDRTKNNRNQSKQNRSSGSKSNEDATLPNKKALTLEQQAKQQKLKAAWKVAMEKGDEGALEKIQMAMEEMEREIMANENKNDSIADEYDGESSLEKIQRAMRESGGVKDTETDRRKKKFESYDEEEDFVGLISELEEATNARFEEEDEE